MFPIVFLAYAAPATLGLMYDVVVRRLRRQYKYNKSGRLSHYNRRWVVWLSVLFALSLLSAFFFVLSAPGWDGAEWALIWASSLVYYPLFQLVKRQCRKEYSERFFKASALKWSAVIMTVLLCTVYAIMGFGAPAADLQDFSTFLQNRNIYFENSTCAVFGEVDKLTTYADSLTQYGLNYVQGASYLAAFVVRIALGASAFFGIVSQLNACLLTLPEIKSEFQLLPGEPDGEREDKIIKRYPLIILGILIVSSSAFLAVEYELSKAEASTPYTEVDRFLDETTSLIVLAADHEIDEIESYVERGEARQDFEDEFRRRIDDVTREGRSGLEATVDAYYQDCVDNVDAYLDWAYGFQGGFARLVVFFGEGMAVDEFGKCVVEPTDRSPVDDAYKSYVASLKSVYDEYYREKQEIDSSAAFRVPTVGERFSGVLDVPELWPTWNGDTRLKIARDVLLGADSNVDRDALRAKIVGFIESEKAALLQSIDDVTNRL